MRAEPSCPRCGGGLHAPGLWSSAWQCQTHGAVHPLQPVVQPTIEAVHRAASTAVVPVWMPWPLPKGWLVTGLAHAGDERTGARATAVACTGPAPLGGACDLRRGRRGARGRSGGALRRPGRARPRCGAGGSGAGRQDPRRRAPRRPSGRCRPSADRAVYVGEAHGCWLWIVLWPENSGFLLIDDFVLTDLRNAGHELDIPFGALSPRLVG